MVSKRYSMGGGGGGKTTAGNITAGALHVMLCSGLGKSHLAADPLPFSSNYNPQQLVGQCQSGALGAKQLSSSAAGSLTRTKAAAHDIGYVPEFYTEGPCDAAREGR